MRSAYREENKGRKNRAGKLRRVVTLLGAAVVFMTTYALILPAITMEAPAFCGHELHTHTSECYTPVLVCGEQDLPEVAQLSAPAMSEEPVCGLEDHTHGADCFDDAGNLICEKEEHTHSDACFAVAQTEEEPAHVHTADCYEYVLTCQQEAHEHTLQCYSDPGADTDGSAWEQAAEQAVAALNDTDRVDTNRRVLAVAQSQDRYTESQLNYWVEEDGATRHGYTLYGAAYGAPYADWNALYVDWVLQKAAVPGFPLGADADSWMESLAELDRLSGTGYMKYAEPREGELVFVRTDDAPEGTLYANRVGIIRNCTDKGVYAYEGSLNGQVAITYYDLTDPRIAGFAALPGTEMPQEVQAAPSREPAPEAEILPETQQTPAPESLAAPAEEIAGPVESAAPAAVTEAPAPAEETPAAEAAEPAPSEEVAPSAEVAPAEETAPQVFFSSDPEEEVSFTAELDTTAAQEPEPERIVTADPDMIAAMQAVEQRNEANSAIGNMVTFFKGLFGGGYDYQIAAEVDGVTVTAEYNEGVFPEKVAMAVTEISAEPYADLVSQATGKEDAALRSYDITFLSGGEILEPAGEVKISFRADFIEEDAEPEIVHIENSGSASVVEGTVTSGEISGITDSFSVYVLSYTVDFHWADEAGNYECSIPGGGALRVADMMLELGVVDPARYADAEALAAEIENAVFSAPELVFAGKAGEETTVGALKEARDLKVEYSGELTEDQIAEINGQTIRPEDWVLVSLRPFTTEEHLTVTMQDGETYTIRVTDAQIATNVLTADGKTYRITLTYEDAAQIPEDTTLEAVEIEAGTEAYAQHLGKAWAEVNRDYLALEAQKNSNTVGLDDYEELHPVNLDDARFFEVRLLYHGKEIEPKAPVHVRIEYVDGLDSAAAEEEQVLGVAHFLEDSMELISDVETERDADGKIVELVYDQGSFSDIGTYVGQETLDNTPFVMNPILAMPKLAALANGTRSGTQLNPIEAHKDLSNNNDGTYTLSLSVKGDSVATEEYNKANILFVMDRSSSMSNIAAYEEYQGTSYNSSTTYYRKNGNDYEALYVQNGQVCTRTQTWNGWRYTPYTGTVYTGVTRLAAEQAAMDALIQNLLGKNDPDTPGKEDLIEISVISFARDRQSGDTEYTNWTSTDYDGLMDAVNQTNIPSGTNWEDALKYAKEQAQAKKEAQPDEDVYVIFLTDGEPTAICGEHSGAVHYVSNGVTTRGGFEYALTEDRTLYSGSEGDRDGENALSRAKGLVDSGYKFYGIFTFNPGEAQTKYLRRLMNYAYTGVDKAYENDVTKEDTDIVKKYFTDADTPQKLTGAFEAIFADVSSRLGHGDVVIKDGLTTADAMTTTINAESAGGYRYSVKNPNGTEMYYVTATGSDSNPTVTFHIGNQDYPAGAPKTGVDGKLYYSVTVGGTEYKMALADLTGRELTWDLSAIGTLLPGCTYQMDIVVWPNQAAYDYVAGLNNELPGYSWDSSVESNPANYHEVTVDGKTYGYYTGGVEGHDSIVKYKDSGVYSVLTNTHQELNYSIVNTKTNEVTGDTTTTSTPQDPLPLEPQKPMDLVDTNSSIEKQWNVDLNPSILAQLLYPTDGSHLTLTFDIYQDAAAEPYKSVSMGWDATQGKYVWEDGSEIEIPYNNQSYSIGTRWLKDFAIPTGLMLSEERMDALGMDKSAYPSGTFPVDPEDPDGPKKTYYLLETGHDYTIKESGDGLGYEFDFNADVFHPMLVDGKMQNVRFTRTGDKTISISSMSQETQGLASLKVENTLRGYIHLEKIVVGAEGTQIATDKTKFEYDLTLTNSEGPFTGNHIPWYGINDLFYHDEDFNYYQAEFQNGQLKLKTEDGTWHDATGDFNPDLVTAQTITYEKDGEPVSVTLYGNQTTASGDKKVASATLQICQGEKLSIANVPAGTVYTITESQKDGYSLVDIAASVTPDDVTGHSYQIDRPAREVTGTIVPNHHNYVKYTNRRLFADIDIQKTDLNSVDLPGAVFQLTPVQSAGPVDLSAVEGIGDVVKVVDGEEITFENSFETNGQIHTLKGLPDGTYQLYEVYAPAGYINTQSYIRFQVQNSVVTMLTENNGLEFTPEGEDQNALLVIENEPGAELPSTGGPGTSLFMILGSALLAGTALLLLMRRRQLY